MLCFLFGCVSNPTSPTVAVLRRICQVDELRDAKTVLVVSKTQPVWMVPALWIYYKDAPTTAEDVEELDRIEADLQRRFEPVAIDIPTDARCAFVAVTPRGETYMEATLIEVSPMIKRGLTGNPTDGMVVRISAGGRPGASFYWVPLVECARGCRVDNVVKLDVHDG